MTSSTHTLRMVVTLVLALAVAMLTVPSAIAAGSCPCNADLPQSLADSQPIDLGPVGTRAAPTGKAPAWLDSLNARSEALNRQNGLGDLATTSSPIVRVVQSSGFAWGGFGIGIAAAVGGLLVLAGIGAAVRHARRAHDRLGTV